MLGKKASMILCFVLSLSMCFSVPAVSFAAQYASAASGSTDPEMTRGTSYILNGVPEMEVYTDSVFRGDSMEYNDTLATMSFVLCSTTQYTKNLDRPDLCFNVRQYLEDKGFTDVEASDDFYYDPNDGTSSPVACAHKKIIDNGKEYTLLALVPKSGTRGSEYTDNSIESESETDTGDYAGYARRSERITAFARKYIEKYGISGDIKVWLTGYSGGGCTAQILGANILRDTEKELGSSVTLEPGNMYCYAFSGMRVASLSGDYKDSIYDYIHNYCENTDLTANLYTQNIFARYGQMTTYSGRGNKERMLELLAMDTPSAYEAYVSSGDPDGFMTLKFDTSALKEGNISMAPDTESYMPKNQPEYRDAVLEAQSELFARSGKGDPRVGYYKEYQGPLSTFSRAVDNDTFLFMQAMTSTRTSAPLMVSMYLTYMTDKSIRDKKELKAQTIEDAFNMLAGMTENADGTLKKEYSGLKYYTQIRDRIFHVSDQDGTRRYELNYDFNSSIENKLILKIMKRLTGRLFAMSFESAFEANGIDRSRYEKFLDIDNSTVVAWAWTSLTFANSCQTGANEPFSLENEQFKQAATFVGNLSRLLTPHNSSNIIEWLRSADDNYADYALADAAQSAGYRRVYIAQPEGTAVSGKVTAANGDLIATFKDGRLISSSDPWVSITACDTGNWLRLPLDQDYTVDLSVNSDTKLGLRLSEYSVSEGKEMRTVDSDSKYNWTKLKAYRNGKVSLSVPAVSAGTDGYVLPSDAEYSVSVSGSAEVKTKYSSSVPKAQNVKAKAGSKSVTVSWKKLSSKQLKKFSKVEVQYSTSKKFKSYKSIDVSKKKTSYKIKGLKKGRKYYIRIRNVKKTAEYRYVSGWSSVRRAVVKQ